MTNVYVFLRRGSSFNVPLDKLRRYTNVKPGEMVINYVYTTDNDWDYEVKTEALDEEDYVFIENHPKVLEEVKNANYTGVYYFFNSNGTISNYRVM